MLTSRATVDRKWRRDISQDSEAPPGKPQGPLLSGIYVDWKVETASPHTATPAQPHLGQNLHREFLNFRNCQGKTIHA